MAEAQIRSMAMTDYQYQSESVAELMKALSKAQGRIQNVTKASLNPHFKSAYADMAAVRTATYEALSAEGITLLQPVECAANLVTVTTELRFGDEFKRAPLQFPLQQANIQAFGSLVSYLRRYGAMSMLGLAAEDDDDDGNKAKDNGGKSAPGADGPVTPAQAEEIKQTIVEVNADLPRFLKAFGIEQIEQMPRRRHAEAMRMLDMKRQQNKPPHIFIDPETGETVMT
jgi:hypothetical protein